MKSESEFGKGLCYCLGLFLAHAERYHADKRRYKDMQTRHPELFSENEAAHSWFYAAGDHICDMTPDRAPTPELKERAEVFKKFVTARRFDHNRTVTRGDEDWEWAVGEALSLLLEIDKAHGIDAEEAQWK